MESRSQEVENASSLNQLKLIENHYFSVSSQGNVYSLVPLHETNGSCKILISSLQKKLVCIEFDDGNYSIHENLLTCVPNGADIISINAYRSSNNIFTIGLTLIIKDGSGEECLLIYTDWDTGRSVNFSQDLSSFSSIPLSYIPYVLFHTDLPTVKGLETVWLLSGGDRRIHLFQLSSDPANRYEHVSVEDKFPELSAVEGITLHMDILYLDKRKSRMTVTSGENGNVHLFKVDVTNVDDPVVVSSRQIQFDFPSSSVKFFYDRKKMSDVINLDFDRETEDEFEDCAKPLVAVATTLESCFVYRTDDMTDGGFQLPEAENFDVVTSCLVCDVNFDGKNEIILGTYGQVILIYKQSTNDGLHWELMHTFSLPSPILALAYEDVLGDGAKELVVSTMAGVHVFQTDPENVSALIIDRLRKLKM